MKTEVGTWARLECSFLWLPGLSREKPSLTSCQLHTGTSTSNLPILSDCRIPPPFPNQRTEERVRCDG
jgi:hypothetical protein